MEDSRMFHSDLDKYLASRAKMRMGSSGQVHLPSFSNVEQVLHSFVSSMHTATNAVAVNFSKLHRDQKIGLAMIFSGSVLFLKGLWDLGRILSA